MVGKVRETVARKPKTRSNQKTVEEGSWGKAVKFFKVFLSLLLASSPIVFSLDLARPCKYEPEKQITPEIPPATPATFFFLRSRPNSPYP